MEVTAKLKYSRISPQKMRLVANLVKGLNVEKANFQLDLSKKRGAAILKKLVNSAVANANEKGGFDTDNLFVKNVMVDQGPVMKRFIPRAQGRATAIQKKMSHITVILDEAR